MKECSTNGAVWSGSLEHEVGRETQARRYRNRVFMEYVRSEQDGEIEERFSEAQSWHERK